MYNKTGPDHENVMYDIGKKIKKLRKEHKMTQERLSSFLNVDRSVISRWESEKTWPTIEQLKNLCDLFGVPVSFFYDEKRTGKKNRDNDDLLRRMKELFK